MLFPARLSLAAGALLALAALPVAAQSGGAAAPAAEPGAAPGRTNQTIERIRTEDAGSRIDELRVGGQTQSITVQPKANVPAYQVRPSDTQGSASSGKRVWTFGQF